MLTKQERATLNFIKAYLDDSGFAPTTREVAEALGISSRGVAHRYITALQTKGYLMRHPHRHRNISIIAQPDFLEADRTIPLMGAIAAGHPIEAVKQDESINMADLFLGKNRYALRVKGDSMIDEGILDGDLVICERRSHASNGQIIVALIDHEVATLKRLLNNEDGTITLLPANTCHQPQTYERDRLTIQGIFIGLMRLTTRHA